MKSRFRNGILFIFGTFVVSCTHPIPVVPDTTTNCAADTISEVSFSKDIIPIFTANCTQSGCHDAATAAGHLDLDSVVAYNNLMKPGSGNVDTTDPMASVLYNQLVTNVDPMPPSYKLDSCSVKLIYKWIQQKAKNN